MPNAPAKRSTRSRLAEELGKSGDFESPEQEAFLNLIRTHEALSEPFERLFREHGISMPLYNILRILRGHARASGGKGSYGTDVCGMPVQRIGSQMLTREPDMTRLVDRLERAGLVCRHRCPQDRRVVLVEITQAGIKLLDALDKPVRKLHRDQLSHMHADRIALLSELLGEARNAP